MTLANAVNSSQSFFSQPIEIRNTWHWLNFSDLYFSRSTTGVRLDTIENPTTNICSFRLNSNDLNGLSRINFNFGDATDAVGGIFLNIFRGNNTTFINHSLAGNADSYLNALTGNLGIGTTTPTDKLHVNGVVRGTSLKMGATPNQHTWGTAIPTTGTWARGDVVWNRSPSASVSGGTTNFVGWVCVTAGTPGTWKGFGAIAV